MSKFAAAALFALAIASPAHSAVINFNGLAGTNMSGNTGRGGQITEFYNSTAKVDGFTFSSTGYEYFISSTYAGGDRNEYAYNGTDFMMAYSTITMRSETANKPFSISSIDLASWQSWNYVYGGTQYTGNYVTSANLVGTRMDGTLISTAITLDSRINSSKTNGNDFTNYVLNGFTGLKSLSITGNTGSYLAVDNINVSAVPEPGSLAILGLGLAGLAAVRRRRK